MADPIRVDALSRRTVLKGLAGAAGLVSIPAIMAACSTPAASTVASAPPAAHVGRQRAGRLGRRAAPPPARVTFGSNYSNKDTDTKAMQAVVDAFTAKTGIAVKVNTVDHNTFQDQISHVPAGHAGRHVHLVRRLPDAVLRRSGPRRPTSSDLWAKIGANFSDAFKASSTGNDGKQYFVPFYNYPWVVIYRKSVFADKGYTVPKTWDEFKTLGDKMKADGLTPLAFGDKDGWPAMGTFDILNMRVNGYQYHIELMKGAQKWTDPKTAAVFAAWKELLPYQR